MNKNFVAGLLIAGLTLPVLAADKPQKSSAEAEALSKAFVVVNGASQPVAWAELLFREQLARGAKDSSELRDGVRENIIANALMEQEAKKSGLDKNLLLQAQAEMAKQAILIRAWQQMILSNIAVDDALIAAEYEAQLKRLGTSEYKIRQLVVADETTAKLLLEKAVGGAKLADLVRDYAKDSAQRDSGGLSDWTNAAILMPQLNEVIGKVGKGKLVNTPIQSQFGWHIVQLEDIRPLNAPSLEEAKPQIVQIIRQRNMEEKVKALRAKARVQ